MSCICYQLCSVRRVNLVFRRHISRQWALPSIDLNTIILCSVCIVWQLCLRTLQRESVSPCNPCVCCTLSDSVLAIICLCLHEWMARRNGHLRVRCTTLCVAKPVKCGASYNHLRPAFTCCFSPHYREGPPACSGSGSRRQATWPLRAARASSICLCVAPSSMHFVFSHLVISWLAFLSVVL